MRPIPTVQLQSAASLAATLVGLLVLQGEGAIGMAVPLSVGAGLWSIFGCRYWTSRRRAATGRPISPRRRKRDRAMLGCFAIGLAAPAAASWAVTWADPKLFTPPIVDGDAVLAGVSGTAVVLSVLVSSSVDWYVIRPFREGLFGDPVCQPTVAEDAKELYLRFWILHRLLSELFTFLAVSAFIALVVAVAKAQTTSEEASNVLDVLGPISILGWTIYEIAKLKAALAFVRHPSQSGLGCWVLGRNKSGQDIEGFVLDAAIEPGVQLIDAPRGHPARDISDSSMSVPLEFRETMRPRTPPMPVCPGGSCQFWIPDCELGLHQHGDKPYP